MTKAKLDRLIKDARTVCKFRGHDMRRFVKLPISLSISAASICKKCGASVVVRTKPLPNEIDIGGSAVAIDCKKGGEQNA